MKMAALSATTGIPVATIKYYLREDLLPAGERVGPTQASYDDSHVRRLRLIKSLVDVGGLSIASTRRVLESIDADITIGETLEVAQSTVSENLDPATIDEASLQLVDEAISGWNVHPMNPGRLAAARVLMTFAAVGQADTRGWVDRYTAAALKAAEADLDEIETRPDRAARAETVVIGTVLGDALFAALRRAAQEHLTCERYGLPPG